jgi:hypothetical protein
LLAVVTIQKTNTNQAPKGVLNTLQMNTETITAQTVEGLKNTAHYFGKDTKRKKSNFYKQWIKDLDYVIDHIEPQLKKNILAWHLGTRLCNRDLLAYKKERNLIQDNFLELIN